MLIYNVDISQTASSGAWSFNTKKFDSVLMKQIVLKAATSTTTFDLTLTDDMDNIVYTTELSATGTLRREMEIPLKGIHTVSVSTASNDELFVGKIMVQEL